VLANEQQAKSGAKAGENPEQFIKTLVDDSLEVVSKNKDKLKSDQRHLVIEKVMNMLVQHFDFTRMTRLAVARNWRRATPEQKSQLSKEFRDLLVRTYSKALTEYDDQEIKIKLTKATPRESEAKVKSLIIDKSGNPIAMDYYLEKSENGWKIFDIEIEGISLVSNYRSSFARVVNNSGIDGLIDLLRKKNKKK